MSIFKVSNFIKSFKSYRYFVPEQLLHMFAHTSKAFSPTQALHHKSRRHFCSWCFRLLLVLCVWTCDPAAAPTLAWTSSTWEISCRVQRYDWCWSSAAAPPNLAKEVTLIKVLCGETGFGWCHSTDVPAPPTAPKHPKHKPADRKSVFLHDTLDISLSWVDLTVYKASVTIVVVSRCVF